MDGEDLDAFLADFGVPCMAASVAFLGLLDQPDELMQLGRAAASSRQYELTFRSDAVALARDAVVLVRGTEHVAREAPHQIGDGAFSRVLLTRT
jgi:hypothetical protein